MARNEDPTRTKTLRRTYGQRLRGAFGRINTVIRSSVAEDDIFGLGDRETEELAITADVSDPPNLDTLDPAEVMAEFESWLNDVQEGEVLDVIDRNDNRFVRQAYERGLKDADTNLRQIGIDTGDAVPIESAIQTPTHESTLQTLFARNYSELDGITSEVSRQVTRELAGGLGEGVNPNEMARRITDRVDKIGKTRATVLARTEVIHTYAEGTLNRYQELGVDEVSVKAEHVTAGDGRVCSECASLEGRTYPIEQARGQIPIHPQCRCSWRPTSGSK